jgi:hypothetical protein
MLSKVINKETILYTVFGILTSVLNVLLFQILLFLNFEYKVSNLISLVVVKITAYICNKNFVFKSKCTNLVSLYKEIFRFIIARGSTMLIDFFGLIIMVDFINFSKLPSKIFITILVVVLNYIIGKKHVFKNSS